MKKLLGILTAVILSAVLAGFGCALAADREIAVQLDGQFMAFTDAVPQVRQERTFLPFRAVFEALGAEVSWSAEEPDAVSASRGGKTVAMTLGSTQVKVTKGGRESVLEMDVAPFAENGRTYVPVRFAAQAFDCAVGWDQEAYCAIIVDVDALAEKAAAGKSFARLEEYRSRAGKYNDGVWAVDMTMDGSLSVKGMELPMTVQAKGVTEGSDRQELEVNTKVDMTTLLVLMQLSSLQSGVPGGLDPEEKEMFDALKTQGIDISARTDKASDVMYFNLKGKLLSDMGISPETWYETGASAAVKDSAGVSTAVGDTAKTAAEYYKAIAGAFLRTMTPVSADTASYFTSYTDFVRSAESLAQALSDEGFTPEGEGWACFIDGGHNKLTLHLSAGGGYGMELYTTRKMGEELSVRATVSVAVDEADRLTGEAGIDAELAEVRMALAGGYAPAGRAPETRPPAGAVIEDTELLKSMWDALNPLN